MYARLLQPPATSCFLFGPRGVGKTAWCRARFGEAVYLDLLRGDLFTALLAAPESLATYLPADLTGWVVIDEVQKIPAILDEVHRLIEEHGLRFVLTGSSARKLRRGGVNLLAGRAVTRYMHPLSAGELGEDFDLEHCLRFGCLPTTYGHPDPGDYLASYVSTYLREEVQQEGLTRRLDVFGRFLQVASFSQGSPLNIAAVARECGIARKVAESYFEILDDLLLASRVPVFTRRARRAMTAHPKFFYFDAGVYRAIRPAGPLDSPEVIDGCALETLVLQQLRSVNDALGLGYSIHYWRSRSGLEVDFVLYGERGLKAIEVKRGARLRESDGKGLQAFLDDYPEAEGLVLYGGSDRRSFGRVDAIPLVEALPRLSEFLS
ncbi:MAG: ATP-binding protein [Planctomycetes bacterium]|nr:ATP-binding protein [Planctomycetota bacterium]